ncbi:MAG: hypothetical protein K1X31_02355, partial [Gemmatimonadaceae bacterium]|nr:hypothetical protein [Gemmatimonadaceae bacterium]
MITRLRLRKAMGDLRAHRGRTVLTWLAVTAALAAAATVLDAWALVREVTRDQYLASAPAAATIVVDPLTPDARARALAAVRAVPGVRDAEAHRAVSTRIQVGGTVLGARLFVSDDPAAQRVGRLRIARGAWPAAAGPDIAIERSSLDFAGLTLGDRVQLGTADGD